MRATKHARGLTRGEVVVTLASAAALAAVALPVIARAGEAGRRDVSLQNLAVLGTATSMFAADNDGAQISQAPADLGAFDSVQDYLLQTGTPGDELAIILGWNDASQLWGFFATFVGNHQLFEPIAFDGASAAFGWFRMANARPLHDYVNGRVYDPVFYAPDDEVVFPLVEPGFDQPEEFVSDLPLPGYTGGNYVPPSYAHSPAALFCPEVLRPEPDGGFQSPWSLDDGFRVPALAQATYASQKTLLIEHHWLRDAPADPCNPALVGNYDGCEPYYFNHATASTPAALFYDMSVRLLPNADVIASDQRLVDQTGFGLWSRDTPLGADGYLGDVSFDEPGVSHHILTTGGITGRDTLTSSERAVRGPFFP